jgi:hypothetical protein
LKKALMNKQHQPGYMLLFIGMDWTNGLSPEQVQQVAGEWMAWFRRLVEEGKATAGHPLALEGKVVGKNRSVTDGPYAEAKEAVGGYFLLDVPTFDDAVAIAQQCPGLPYGARVEVRPVLTLCPLSGVPVEKEIAVAK